LISAVLGPLGPRITIYIGTSHRRSNESSLKYNSGHSNCGKWVHTTTKLTLAWLLISIPLVILVLY
jgi:hypothetical protein